MKWRSPETKLSRAELVTRLGLWLKQELIGRCKMQVTNHLGKWTLLTKLHSVFTGASSGVSVLLPINCLATHRIYKGVSSFFLGGGGGGGKTGLVFPLFSF